VKMKNAQYMVDFLIHAREFALHIRFYELEHDNHGCELLVTTDGDDVCQLPPRKTPQFGLHHLPELFRVELFVLVDVLTMI